MFATTQGYQIFFPNTLQKVFWSFPFCLGCFMVNLQLLHWAQMCDSASMKGMSESIQRKRTRLIGYSFFIGEKS